MYNSCKDFLLFFPPTNLPVAFLRFTPRNLVRSSLWVLLEILVPVNEYLILLACISHHHPSLWFCTIYVIYVFFGWRMYVIFQDVCSTYTSVLISISPYSLASNNNTKLGLKSVFQVRIANRWYYNITFSFDTLS